MSGGIKAAVSGSAHGRRCNPLERPLVRLRDCDDPARAFEALLVYQGGQDTQPPWVIDDVQQLSGRHKREAVAPHTRVMSFLRCSAVAMRLISSRSRCTDCGVIQRRQRPRPGKSTTMARRHSSEAVASSEKNHRHDPPLEPASPSALCVTRANRRSMSVERRHAKAVEVLLQQYIFTQISRSYRVRSLPCPGPSQI